MGPDIWGNAAISALAPPRLHDPADQPWHAAVDQSQEVYLADVDIQL